MNSLLMFGSEVDLEDETELEPVETRQEIRTSVDANELEQAFLNHCVSHGLGGVRQTIGPVLCNCRRQSRTRTLRTETAYLTRNIPAPAAHSFAELCLSRAVHLPRSTLQFSPFDRGPCSTAGSALSMRSGSVPSCFHSGLGSRRRVKDSRMVHRPTCSRQKKPLPPSFNEMNTLFENRSRTFMGIPPDDELLLHAASHKRALESTWR
jgi:hypothetical protein